MKHYAWRFEPCGHVWEYNATSCPVCRIEELVAGAPPLTPEQADRIAALLNGGRPTP